MRLIIGLALVALGSSAIGQDKHLDRQAAKLAKLTPDYFAKRIKVQDDNMTTIALVTSRGAYRGSHGLMDDVQGDVALDASIDKKTNAVTYRVIGLASYEGNWRFFESADYATGAGPQHVVLEDVQRSVGACLSIVCSFSETMSFAIDPATLATVAATTTPWRLRFGSKTGSILDESMSPYEIGAVLQAVAKYRAAHPV